MNLQPVKPLVRTYVQDSATTGLYQAFDRRYFRKMSPMQTQITPRVRNAVVNTILEQIGTAWRIVL